jgi:hypothetical protein
VPELALQRPNPLADRRLRDEVALRRLENDFVSARSTKMRNDSRSISKPYLRVRTYPYIFGFFSQPLSP